MNRFKRYWTGIPSWIILGAVVILVPIFVFWTLQNINKQKENTTLLLLEKGDALIRSFEAGARTGMRGMLGMHGIDFKPQRLLTETAQQPGVVHIIVTDTSGTIKAHSDPDKIGEAHGTDLDLEEIISSQRVEGRQVVNPGGADTFEVFRLFSSRTKSFHPPPTYDRMPSGSRYDSIPRPPRPRRGPTPFGEGFDPTQQRTEPDQIIFVGLDMGPIEAARKEDARNTVVMASILLLIGFAGIVSLSLAQAYRSAKTSLTKIKAFSDTVVENMPIGLLAIDADGKIASFNETAESVLRLSSPEILGKKANEVLPGQLLTLTDELDNRKGIIEREMDCALEDGRIIPLQVIVSPLEGNNNISLGFITLFRDLTEIQELKREVERTQRLASLGKVAAGIAHEIRNPLSSIKGFATYFKGRYKEIPEDQKTADIMVQEVERLNRVIGQLLEFARPINIQKKPTSLHSVIQHSLKMIEAQAQAKNIKINTGLSPQIKDILSVDPDRINQVLLNLYLNSIEAMENGGTLSVNFSQDENPQRTKIAVSDTGVGISKEDLVRIFDPYFTTKQSGTGLGLAIVHNIIESHKGEMRVESEPGKGTTVTILLPVS